MEVKVLIDINEDWITGNKYLVMEKLSSENSWD